MKKSEILSYLIDYHLDTFVATRRETFYRLSAQQTMFCCCGRLATGHHESSCTKFNNKVDAETIKSLRHLLPNQ